MKLKTTCIVASLLVVLYSSTGSADGPPAWDRQEANKHGWIYDDLDAGIAKAKETGKPILAVLRCPP